MKPRILVLYFTQTGQLQQVLENIVAGIAGNAIIDSAVIEPIAPFPFPWTASQYYDTMPETVLRMPAPIHPLPASIFERTYDLVILGYQPWFLNPSQPVTAFLQSPQAAMLKDTPVVTVIGCSKMWLHAQEKVKEYLTAVNARLVGNIVLKDCYPLPISSLTALRWCLKGKKEASPILPAAGIHTDDIYAARHFGAAIYKHLAENNLIDLQRDLLLLGAVEISTYLVVSERRHLRLLTWGADFIRKKGLPGSATRIRRVHAFKRLMTLIFLSGPLFTIITILTLLLKSNALLKDVAYFKETEYEPDRM